MRNWGLLTETTVAIDGSKFKAVNHRDRNFTSGKMKTRMEFDREEHRRVSDAARSDGSQGNTERAATGVRLKERITTLKQEMRRLRGLKSRMGSLTDGQVSLIDPDARSMASQGKNRIVAITCKLR